VHDPTRSPNQRRKANISELKRRRHRCGVCCRTLGIPLYRWLLWLLGTLGSEGGLGGRVIRFEQWWEARRRGDGEGVGGGKRRRRRWFRGSQGIN